MEKLSKLLYQRGLLGRYHKSKKYVLNVNKVILQFSQRYPVPLIGPATKVVNIFFCNTFLLNKYEEQTIVRCTRGQITHNEFCSKMLLQQTLLVFSFNNISTALLVSFPTQHFED